VHVEPPLALEIDLEEVRAARGEDPQYPAALRVSAISRASIP